MAIPATRGAEVRAAVAALTAECTASGFALAASRPIDYGTQLSLTRDGRAATINVYGGKAGLRIVVGGERGTAAQAALQAIADRCLAGNGRSAGQAAGPVGAGDASSRPASDAAGPPSGTASAAGRPGTGSAAAGTRGLAALQRSSGATSRFPPPPWIGSDESGKGDYFGPLVTAAVHATAADEPLLRRAGVQDSKLLEDRQAQRIAAEIRRICAGRFAEDVLAPAEYNETYAQFRAAKQNLNHLLAGGHVRVLEAVLTAVEQAPPPPAVIADQFADERHVRLRLQAAMQARGLPMPSLLQVPRAEANVAVAAASILARDRFLAWLQEASARLGVDLPKGGSKPSIIAAARRIVQLHGEAALATAAKLHFTTTQKIFPLG